MNQRDRKRAAIDRLIDFREQQGADPRRPIHVEMTVTNLAKLLGRHIPEKGSKELVYRDHVLICTLPDPAAERFVGGKL